MNNHRFNRLAILITVFISVLTGMIIAEIIIRVNLFGYINILPKLRNPSLYADWLDEDYWKLEALTNDKYIPPANPHSLLGWTGNFDSLSLLHNDSNSAGERKAVLLYGDSFAAAVTENKFQDILNADAEFSQDHYLLNYGVNGYGLGQIYLLLKNTIHLYDDPVIILSFMTLDTDRSLMSFRSGQKPFFHNRNDSVVQGDITVEIEALKFLDENPPVINSYALSFLMRNKHLSPFFKIFSGDENRKKEIIKVNKYLINQIVTELRKKKLKFLFVLFHPFRDMESDSTIFSKKPDWRTEFAIDEFKTLGAPYISARDIIQKDALLKGKNERNQYFLPSDGHPNEIYNRLVAEKIKCFVLNK